MDTANTPVRRYQIFTFAVDDMLFGLDVSRVLMLDQDIERIQALPIEQHGFCGVVKCQGKVVPVLDFAAAIGRISELASKARLADQLSQFEQQLHHYSAQWQQAVAPESTTIQPRANRQPLKQQLPMTNPILSALVDELNTPYQQWLDCLEKSATLRHKNAMEQADEQWRLAQVCFKQINSLIQQLHDYIETGIRPVLLFITDDGKTPLYAMVVTDIRNVVEYKQLQDIQNGADPVAAISGLKRIFNGIFTDADNECFYLNTQAFLGYFSAIDSIDEP